MDPELARVTEALAACWSRWSADPTEVRPWSAANPAAGHCWVSAMILRDRFGGELIEARVEAADGSDADWHYWNRLPNGTELDVTREQFRAGERLLDAHVVDVPAQLDTGPMIGPYRLLAGQVTRWLAGEAPSGPLAPSIKAVCRDGAGRLLVCRTPAGDWELPGGRPEPGEHYAEALVREVAEETALAVSVGRLLGVEPLLTPSGWVAIVAFACELVTAAARVGRPGEPFPAVGPSRHNPVPGDEHTEVAFLTDAELADAGFPDVHRQLAALA